MSVKYCPACKKNKPLSAWNKSFDAGMCRNCREYVLDKRRKAGLINEKPVKATNPTGIKNIHKKTLSSGRVIYRGAVFFNGTRHHTSMYDTIEEAVIAKDKLRADLLRGVDLKPMSIWLRAQRFDELRCRVFDLENLIRELKNGTVRLERGQTYEAR